MAQFAIDPSYNEVADRIAEFREKFPSGALRPFREPYTLNVGDQHYIVYAAGVWRDAGDEAPAGVGYAWEPVPGLTPYTKNSELMNAETSAWGRALVAALVSTSKKIASREEVAARQAEDSVPPAEAEKAAESVSRPSPKPKPENTSRVYLDVPYAEKDEAKAAGARWDKAARAWYIPQDANPFPLLKWVAGGGDDEDAEKPF